MVKKHLTLAQKKGKSWSTISRCNGMEISDPVRVYDGDWYSEGRIIEIDDTKILVDFMDWIQQYDAAELQERYIYYQRVLIPTSTGITVEDFR